MTDDFFFFLYYHAIPQSTVSVANCETYSSYYFYISKGIGENTFIELHSSYSYADIKECYANYKLYKDEQLIAEATQPVINKKALNHPTLKMNTADQLELLLKRCSTKILLQEKVCQKNHMLKSTMKNYNQRQN